MIIVTVLSSPTVSIKLDRNIETINLTILLRSVFLTGTEATITERCWTNYLAFPGSLRAAGPVRLQLQRSVLYVRSEVLPGLGLPARLRVSRRDDGLQEETLRQVAEMCSAGWSEGLLPIGTSPHQPGRESMTHLHLLWFKSSLCRENTSKPPVTQNTFSS